MVILRGGGVEREGEGMEKSGWRREGRGTLSAYCCFTLCWMLQHRFATQSCPICFKLKNSLNAEYKSLQFLLETCTKTSNATLNSESDRSIQFQNLVIFGWFSTFPLDCFCCDFFPYCS